jgi:hypothetical protein
LLQVFEVAALQPSLQPVHRLATDVFTQSPLQHSCAAEHWSLLVHSLPASG